MTEAGRWEHGSEFHHVAPVPGDLQADAPPWRGGLLVGSGRDALRLVARHGRAARQWRRFWIPTYLCQEVVAAIATEGLPLVAYPDLPGRPLELPAASPGDAVLVVNTFGRRGGPPPAPPPGVDLVEDHTHDPTSPWAFVSRAEYAVASLRKTLPVPEGGVLWSPRGLPLPPAPPLTLARREAAEAKRQAMVLKSRYLDGESVEKEEFRRLALAGEARIASGEVSAMSDETRALLETLPARRWRAARARNQAFLAARLAHLHWLEVLTVEAPSAVCFSAVLVFDQPVRRDRVRTGLIARRVYPAVLWPLEETVLPVGGEARALSRRILSLHCDARYTEADMARVADLVEEAGTS